MDRERRRRLRAVDNEDDWERVLAAAAHLQQIVPDHRFSHDDDHVLVDLKSRFDDVLGKLEDVANWNTARTRRPVLILGQLDGVDTGIRNLIRVAPLETARVETAHGPITLPTIEEMLRIKAWLVVTRNETRDYIDVAALSHRIARTHGDDAVDRAGAVRFRRRARTRRLSHSRARMAHVGIGSNADGTHCGSPADGLRARAIGTQHEVASSRKSDQAFVRRRSTARRPRSARIASSAAIRLPAIARSG